MTLRPFKNWERFLDYIRSGTQRVYFSPGAGTQPKRARVQALDVDGDRIEAHSLSESFETTIVGRSELWRFTRP